MKVPNRPNRRYADPIYNLELRGLQFKRCLDSFFNRNRTKGLVISSKSLYGVLSRVLDATFLGKYNQLYFQWICSRGIISELLKVANIAEPYSWSCVGLHVILLTLPSFIRNPFFVASNVSIFYGFGYTFGTRFSVIFWESYG